MLGLHDGATKREVKAAYYELAKICHPDVVGSEGEQDAENIAARFLQIASAFEMLMDADLDGDRTRSAGSSVASAARGGGRGPGRSRKAAGSGGRSLRKRSLGEVLCDQLEDDPHAAGAVWGDIRERGLDVHESMLDVLFRACAVTGQGLPRAIAILREATDAGLLSRHARMGAIVSLIKWCKEDRGSFEMILNELDETERTPAVMELVGNANFLYSGYADGYSIK